MNANLRKKVWQDPKYFIAFGFGSGLMPIAPGTWGTIAAIPIYLLIWPLHWLFYLLFVLVSFIMGIWLCGKVENEIGIHDYAGIVWDEVVGYLLTMAMVPPKLGWIIIGFLLFRLFDIWKPQPIKYVDQHINGGLGIMLDDLLAAVPALLIMHVIIWILPYE